VEHREDDLGDFASTMVFHLGEKNRCQN
jgi:hypothetical protein